MRRGELQGNDGEHASDMGLGKDLPLEEDTKDNNHPPE